jgi:predicted PurR-regulated permease PerM
MQNFEPSMQGQGAVRAASAVIILSFVLSLLYLARTVFEPLAIAVLLAFILTPPIRWLRRYRVGRITSVFVVVAFAVGVIAAFGFMMETEVTRLAGEAPLYQSNLRGKVESLNNELHHSGALSRFSETLNRLASELDGSKSGKEQESPRDTSPVPVQLVPPRQPALEYLENLIGPLIVPLTAAGLLVLFLVFILIYREDLRDRILRLGGSDLHRSTLAMNEAGQRLSRYFLIQTAINTSFGFGIFLGLWAIGVPNPVLWGMVAAIFRFVPYIGTPIAGVIPVLLAAAIDPGWTEALATIGLFFGLELITGQLIEPVLQGQQTGLSPVAIVLSQLFWTLIWGPIGLLLAVPVTVCIEVLGRHIEALSFIGVMLGDEPALAPHEGFYQRILAGDATEATFQAEKRLATEPLSDYYDEVPMSALSLAQADADAGKLSREQQAEICETIEDIVDYLSDYSDEAPKAKGAKEAEKPEGQAKTAETKKDQPLELPPGPYPVLLIPAKSPIDQAASLLLAHVLEKRGLSPAVEPYSRARPAKNFKPSAPQAPIVCVSCFGAFENPAPVRYLIRRWRRLLPNAAFAGCFWRLEGDAEKLEEWRNYVGADFAAGTLKEAASICCREAAGACEAEAQPAVSAARDAAPLKAAE